MKTQLIEGPAAEVAALTLHENPDPFSVQQPSGTIDTRKSVYEQLDDFRVKLTSRHSQDFVFCCFEPEAVMIGTVGSDGIKGINGVIPIRGGYR